MSTGSADTIGKLHTFGWLAFLSAGLIWVAWVSASAVANGNRSLMNEDRQRTQYEQLREDIAELKTNQRKTLEEITQIARQIRLVTATRTPGSDGT